MRRWLTRILICLALGAVTTVGVAWGLAVLLDPSYTLAIEIESGVEESDLGYWEVFSINRFGTNRIDSRLISRDMAESKPSAADVLPIWCEAEARKSFATIRPFPLNGPTFLARGWPSLSLWHRQEIGRAIRSIEGAKSIGLSNFERGDPRVLPLRPIFPGFLIDTLFYGAIWLGLIVGLGPARRALRTRRGRCPQCAYDLRGDLDAGCPECGWGREEAEE